MKKILSPFILILFDQSNPISMISRSLIQFTRSYFRSELDHHLIWSTGKIDQNNCSPFLTAKRFTLNPLLITDRGNDIAALIQF